MGKLQILLQRSINDTRMLDELEDEMRNQFPEYNLQIYDKGISFQNKLQHYRTEWTATFYKRQIVDWFNLHKTNQREDLRIR